MELKRHLRQLTLSMLSMTFSFLILADDTDVFVNRSNLPSEELTPNFVLVLDTSMSMGSPINPSAPLTINAESESYDSSVSYPRNLNYAGGEGNKDYFHLYRRDKNEMESYFYFNKVHKDQMLCDLYTVLDPDTPYQATADRFIFDHGIIDWNNGGLDSSALCSANDKECTFNSSATGPSVDCRSERKKITESNRYIENGVDLFAVNENFHNFIQSYYRYSTMQTTLRELVSTKRDINVALVKYNGWDGGYVFHQAENLSDITAINQESLIDAINNMSFDDGTPIVESLWESYLYITGQRPEFGNVAGANTVSKAYSTATTYDTPIDFACQKSTIVLITDGSSSPNKDLEKNSVISSPLYAGFCLDSCLDEFSAWLHTDGLNIRDHSPLPGIQGIDIHTIALTGNADVSLLRSAATKGGGKFYYAENTRQLRDALFNIVNQTKLKQGSFVAPAVGVNAYNGLQHRNELYYALFQPKFSTRWSGNIKKYKFINKTIFDANDEQAIDESTGYFFESAKSYWTTATDWDSTGTVANDGGNIAYGGFAHMLNFPNLRNVFTFTGSTPSNLTLSSSASAFKVSNTAITTELLNLGPSDVSSEKERGEIINWARGSDANGQLSHYTGDFIHSQPAVVTYGTQKSANCNSIGSTNTLCFDDTVFAGSNLGFLHAINAQSGNEEFAFIPKELLPNLTQYYRDTGSITNKLYGLDAPMAVWREDKNKNGNIDPGDHVYLYQPMRRGGTHYYALDVTDRDNPKLMWQITGTAFDANSTGNFRDLAQTWSTPKKARIQWACSTTGVCQDKTVLFFSGGYDTVHDTATAPTTGDRGNAIYMVDAISGDLLWSAGKSGHNLNISSMQNSIPASVSVSDVDGDGYTELLIAIDIQGNIWRFDFEKEPANADTFAFGGKIAALGGSGKEFRRFYNTPDVAYFAKRGKVPFLSISVTSGYRASPNETEINDHLFVIYDQHALHRPVNADGNPNYKYVNNHSTIRISDITNVATSTTAPSLYGWRKPLTSAGEKGLSRTVTFDGQIVMTTFTPSPQVGCDVGQGESRYYLLDILTGESKLENKLPFETLLQGGIPPEPVIIYGIREVCIADCDTNDAVLETQTIPSLCVGTQCIVDDLKQSIKKTYWRENR